VCGGGKGKIDIHLINVYNSDLNHLL